KKGVQIIDEGGFLRRRGLAKPLSLKRSFEEINRMWRPFYQLFAKRWRNGVPRGEVRTKGMQQKNSTRLCGISRVGKREQEHRSQAEPTHPCHRRPLPASAREGAREAIFMHPASRTVRPRLTLSRKSDSASGHWRPGRSAFWASRSTKSA